MHGLCLGIGLVHCTAALALPRCFPPDFVFGGTAYHEEGTSPRASPFPDVACRSPSEFQCSDWFHRLDEALARMSKMGVTSFRFSIAWSRAMRWNKETRRMAPNPHGTRFYHTLLDKLQAHGLQPIVILSNLELPFPLATHLMPTGWLDPDIVAHFQDFADVVFREYGEKVKYWATFDKPLTFLRDKYQSYDANMALSMTHNVLLAHAGAVALFRKLKAETTNPVAASARIGIVLNTEFSVPGNTSSAYNGQAAERTMELDLGWFLMPLITGDYSETMRTRGGSRLPQFSHQEVTLVKYSYDVIMLDHDNSRAVTDASNSYLAAIKWLHDKDLATKILLTETGWGDKEDEVGRSHLLQVHVDQVYKAVVEQKLPIIGYTAWSLLAYKEWGSFKLQPNVNVSSPINLLTARCLNGSDRATLETSADEKQALPLHEKNLHTKTSGDTVGLVWSLSDVIILVLVGVVVLVAITCEVMRELRSSSRGSREEFQVLITVED